MKHQLYTNADKDAPKAMKTVWGDKPEGREKCMKPACQGHWQEVRGAGDRRGWIWMCTKDGCSYTPAPLSQ